MLSANIQSVGVLGPGLADWPAASAVLRGEVAYVCTRTVLPVPAMLPAAERRRASRTVRLALAVAAEAVTGAGANPRELPTIFSSSGGDGDNCHEICRALASSDRQLSPTRFHNSVHNAACGYWSIAYGCAEASIALCAHDASFGAGLLEALSQLRRGAGAVLLVSYDADYPPPMRDVRPIPDIFGVALLLTCDEARPALARLRVSLSDATTAAGLAIAQLEALRRSIPAARSLTLLERLAQRRSGALVLDYMDTARLAVEVEA